MPSSIPLRLLLAGLLGPVAEAVRIDKKLPPCMCLNWKKTYESQKVACGDGLETFTYSRTIGKRMETNHFCEGASVYNLQDGMRCTKVLQGSSLPAQSQNWTDGAWCYVSSKCDRLNGGAQVNADVSWKACKRNVDPFLADLTPEELISFANRNQQDVGMMVAMAYPIYRGLTFDEAREVFVKGNVPGKLSEDQRDRVEDAVDRQRHLIFCSSPPAEGNPDACGPGEVWVTRGRDVWRMGTRQCKVGTEGCTPIAL